MVKKRPMVAFLTQLLLIIRSCSREAASPGPRFADEIMESYPGKA
jgi:hypothetical protein